MEWVDIKSGLPSKESLDGSIDVQVNVYECYYDKVDGLLVLEQNIVVPATYDVNEHLFILDKETNWFFNPHLPDRNSQKIGVMNYKVTHWAYLNDPIKIIKNE